MSAPVSLGVLLSSEYSVGEVVALAQLSERLGYAHFWLTDVPLSRDCYVSLTMAAVNTTEIKLGPGVSNPFSRHPGILATLIGTLDEVSDGRALLGLGAGGSGFAELGLSTRVPVTALREATSVIRALLQGERFSLDGKTIAMTDAQLAYKPVRAHIPVHFATHGTLTTRLAGRVADGILLANVLVPEALDYYLARLHEGVDGAGRPRSAVEVSLRFEVCLSDDRDAAAHVMRRRVAGRLLSQYPKWDYLEHLGVHLPSQFVDIAHTRGSAGLHEAMRALPDEVLRRTVLFGTPEEIAEQIRRVLRPEVVRVTIRPHTTQEQEPADVIREFATRVYPLLTGPGSDATPYSESEGDLQ